MLELYRQSISGPVLPFTILLVVMVIYWLFVILGALDADVLDFDWMPDLDAEVDSGLLYAVANLLRIGEIPFSIAASLMILFWWAVSVLANYFINPGHSVIISLLLLVAIFPLGIIVAGFVLRPFIRFFRSSEMDSGDKLLYRTGKVVTSRVDETFGRIKIETGGAPFILQARSVTGNVFLKGEPVVIYDEDKDKGIYYVDKFTG